MDDVTIQKSIDTSQLVLDVFYKKYDALRQKCFDLESRNKFLKDENVKTMQLLSEVEKLKKERNLIRLKCMQLLERFKKFEL